MKINNINKKIIAGLMIGTIALSSGCGLAEISYKENDKGIVEIDGDVSYNKLKSCYLLEMEINNKVDLYICDLDYLDNEGAETIFDRGKYVYRNIFDDNIIYTAYKSDDNKEPCNVNKLIKQSSDIDKYLVYFNKVKSSYSQKEIEEILKNIKSIYKFSDSSKEKAKQKILN